MNLFCGKNYKHRQGLYKHKKACTFLQEMENKDSNINLSQSSDVKYLTSLVLEPDGHISLLGNTP